MNSPPHLLILKRAGWVLLVIGMIDIGVMVYCIANKIAYSSSLNILAVIGGIFLMRGNLRAASIVRGIGIFMIAAFASVLLVSPLLQPPRLTLVQIRLNPSALVQSLVIFVIYVALIWWLIRQLGQQEVLAAQASAGRKLISVRVAVAAGIALAVILAVSVTLVQRTESAARAVSLAQEQLGPGYQYHVGSLSYQSSGNSSSASGVVIAWNEVEVKSIPFQWRN